MQNLITLHGGTFHLQSELRKGTQAIVHFPPARVLQSMRPLQKLGGEKHRKDIRWLIRKPAVVDAVVQAGEGRVTRLPRLRRASGG